jgi:uncharacterized hydrophobic protein (TIGR00341 family)
MAQRLVKVTLPADAADALTDELSTSETAGYWQEERDGGQSVVSVLCGAEQVEGLLERLGERFSGTEGFRLIVLPVEASLTGGPDLTAGGILSPGGGGEGKAGREAGPRISREELYSDVADGAVLTVPYAVLICLSTVVAAIGLWRDSVAVVIGAMVIAPLLGPNVGMALSTTLADGELGRRSLRTFMAGVLLALALSFAMGLILAPDTATGEISSRTVISPSDIVLALAAGAAGVMALTTGAASAVIGVMVAVALLPPLVAAGLLLGAMEWSAGGSALLLFVTNVVSINLAGVVTFLLQGVKPMTWWEEGRAKRLTRRALLFWTLLLAALLALVLLAD